MITASSPQKMAYLRRCVSGLFLYNALHLPLLPIFLTGTLVHRNSNLENSIALPEISHVEMSVVSSMAFLASQIEDMSLEISGATDFISRV